MRKIIYSLLYFAIALTTFSSCDDQETYADRKERENNHINNFIYGKSVTSQLLFPEGIQVINEFQFMQQNYKTYGPPAYPLTQFVLFEGSGVYMHIDNEGCGEEIKDGEYVDILCRYTEYNLNSDMEQSSNRDNMNASLFVDVMSVNKQSGTYTASFLSGYMLKTYESTVVPNGWLVPLSYIRIGRPKTEDENIAHVKLIIPHGQGHAAATQSVYACFYDITYERGN